MVKKVYKVEISQEVTETATAYIVAENAKEAKELAGAMELDDHMFEAGDDYGIPKVTDVEETDEDVADYE